MQGKDDQSASDLLQLATRMESLGASAILVEMVPASLGRQLSESLSIPVIGIGAGPYCDGQVLSLHDILGFSGSFSPRFVKQYEQMELSIKSAFLAYKQEVEAGQFPAEEHCF